jgi:hypothetical protein
MPAPKNLPVEGEITVDGVPFDLDEAYAALKVDPTHVIEQLTEQPSLYSYWSVLSEEADVILLTKKRRLDRIEAEADDRLRREARDDDEKVTEPVIARRILRESDYEEALEAMIEARRNAAYLGVIKRALEQRLSALIAVNNRDRAEMAAVGREGN